MYIYIYLYIFTYLYVCTYMCMDSFFQYQHKPPKKNNHDVFTRATNQKSLPRTKADPLKLLDDAWLAIISQDKHLPSGHQEISKVMKIHKKPAGRKTKESFGQTQQKEKVVKSQLKEKPEKACSLATQIVRLKLSS